MKNWSITHSCVLEEPRNYFFIPLVLCVTAIGVGSATSVLDAERKCWYWSSAKREVSTLLTTSLL